MSGKDVDDMRRQFAPPSQGERDDTVYVEKWATYSFFPGTGWSVTFWDQPQDGQKSWRILVPVPIELVKETMNCVLGEGIEKPPKPPSEPAVRPKRKVVEDTEGV